MARLLSESISLKGKAQDDSKDSLAVKGADSLRKRRDIFKNYT